MLFFNPMPPNLLWAEYIRERWLDGSCVWDPELKSIPGLHNSLERCDGVAYFLQHGGEVFRHPVERMDETTLARIEVCLPFQPTSNGMTFELAKRIMVLRPDLPHYLFCQTALFLEMPEAASFYPIPMELWIAGARRYGGGGICHAGALKQVRKYFPDSPHRRTINVIMGDTPNVSAFLDGKPVETSLGFSKFGGLPTRGGCGALDPSIPIELCLQGNRPEQVACLLTQQSGFAALGCEGDMIDLIRQPHDSLAYQVIRNRMAEAVGACMAALGGLDELIFTVDVVDLHQEQARHDVMDYISDLCQNLAFAGVKIHSFPDPTAVVSLVSREESRVAVYMNTCYFWANARDAIGEYIA